MNAFLMYYFALHSTTGVSPAAELLCKRKFCTKLPEFEVLYFDDL